MNTDPSRFNIESARFPRKDCLNSMEEGRTLQRPVVLLVDSDEQFRRVVLNELSNHEYAVLTETSAGAAINTLHRLVNREEPVLLITDVLGLESDGGEIFGGLDLLVAARDMGDDVPVVLMSDEATFHLRQRAYRLGADHFLTKPDLSVPHQENALRDFGTEISLIAHRLSRFAKQAAQPKPSNENPAENFVEASSKQLRLVKTIIEELEAPEASQEISLLVLRLAAEYVERGVLFLVRDDRIVGLGGFGKTGDHEFINEKTRRLEIPVEADTVFRRVMETMSGHKGELPETEWNQRLIQGLGTIVPTEALVLPVKSRNSAVALLYGDNGTTQRSIGDTEGLEIFLSQAGIAMENTFLQRQLASREKM